MERGQRFKRRALRRGYKVDEVDDFLDRVESTLAGEDIDDPVGPDEVRDVIFKTRWGGYDEWHVDMELDRLERQLEELLDDPSAIRGSSGFLAIGHRNSLALPVGSSPAEEEEEPLEPGVYRSSSTGEDLSFADLSAGPRTRATTMSNASDANMHGEATHRGGAPTQAGIPPRSRPAPGPVSPAVRSRTRNVAPRPTPSPSPVQPAEHGGWIDDDLQPTIANPRADPPIAPPPRTRPVPKPEIDPYAPRHGKTEMTVEVPTYGGDVSPFTGEDKARLIELKESFKLRRFGSGYEPSQVERLWDAIAAAMGGQASAQVNDSDFDTGQFALVQGGYFEQEVDAALREVRDLFRRRLG
ncbi:MAG: DivIVA domain-containing protein [Pseudonocardiaceae bacterium]